MNPIRRMTVQAVAALAAGLLLPLRALAAWNKEAFQAKTAADALKNLGIASSAESKDVLIEAPQIAENGAVVPIEITSNVPNTKSIAIVIGTLLVISIGTTAPFSAICGASISTSLLSALDAIPRFFSASAAVLA